MCCPINSIIFINHSPGFTDLSERYNRLENGGASKLSQVLNTYLGGIVQEILGQGGDIAKFSGDAVLVLFKTSSSVSLPDAIHRAIDTAIVVQSSFGRYETDVGVTLRIKIAISAGEVHFSLIGSPTFSHYIVVGQPVWKVKLAERISFAGDIIVTNYGEDCGLYFEASKSQFESSFRITLQLGVTFMIMNMCGKEVWIRCISK